MKRIITGAVFGVILAASVAVIAGGGYTPASSGGGGLSPTNNLSDLDNAATARTNLGLGTAATLSVGTGASNVVQLDGSAKMPAVDGSALTNLPAASRDLTLTVTPNYLWDPHVDVYETGGSQAAVSMHGQMMSGGVFANGRYAVACDGSTDHASMPDTTVGVPANYTIIAVLRSHDISALRWVWGMTTSGLASTNSWGLTGITSTGLVQTQFGDGANYSVTQTTTSLSENTWYVVAVRYTNGDDNADIFFGGVEQAETKTVANATSTGGADNDFSFCRGGEYATSEWLGHLGAVAIYTSALTDQQISDVTDDLESAYGL